MIYTIGRTDSYTRYFKEQTNPQKAVGGSVWRTFNEAYFHTLCEDDYTVYGVLANWETDTVKNPHPSSDWHDLLINANLVQLGDNQ